MTISKSGKPPPGVTAEHVDYIAHERGKGAKWADIAATVGVSPKLLSSWWALRMPDDERRWAKGTRYNTKPGVNKERARPRTCLRCQIIFDSEGPHNRMCNRCRTSD
jgi:hypothetical protein